MADELEPGPRNPVELESWLITLNPWLITYISRNIINPMLSQLFKQIPWNFERARQRIFRTDLRSSAVASVERKLPREEPHPGSAMFSCAPGDGYIDWESMMNIQEKYKQIKLTIQNRNHE